MPQYIAFLRAINVGGRRLKMDVLRDIFIGINGLSQIETFIASGNVIFDSDTDPQILEPQIETVLNDKLGYIVETFIRTFEDLRHITQNIPFSDYNPDADSLYIGFLRDAPSDEAQAKLAMLQSDIDLLQVNKRELYWLCRKSISESKLSGNKIEKTLSMPTTLRDISTIHKLLAKYNR